MNLRVNVSLVFAVVAASAIGCAQMQRDWEAQQAAQAKAMADAQPVNMERWCKAVQQGYCDRCRPSQADCANVYVACVGSRSPADPSPFTMGQTGQCNADIGAGDCAVMPRVWPASCAAPTPQVAQGEPAQPQVEQAPTCPEGAQWDGAECVCPQGTGWSGQACVSLPGPSPTPPKPRFPNCRVLVIDKGYGPGAVAQCNGAEPFCAQAVLDKGYGPGALVNCRGVKGRCAVAVINRGFGPGALENCRGVDAACAVEMLDKGYGPGALQACRR